MSIARSLIDSSPASSPKIKMQHEFDNTLDALLRRAAARRAAGEVLPENANHLDADALAAFAENALPAAARANFAAHLADCSDCRQSLVNFAAIQEAEESEIVETKEVGASLTWRERFARLFTLPNLGYAAAALTVLFFGVFGFIAFQSRQQTVAPQIAQVETETAEKLEQKRRASRPQAPEPEPTVENTPENQIEVPMNFAEPSNPNLAENTNQSDAEQSPNRGLPPSYRAASGQTNNAETTARRETETPRETARAASASNNTANGNTAAAATPKTTPLVAVTQSNENRGLTAQAAPKATADSEAKLSDRAKSTELPALGAQENARPALMARKLPPPRTVGSRKFQKLGSEWRDENYKGQAIIGISRGTDEYKKLDAGLRSIAESFGGEIVIVVWQGKAYRIR